MWLSDLDIDSLIFIFFFFRLKVEDKEYYTGQLLAKKTSFVNFFVIKPTNFSKTKKNGGNSEQPRTHFFPFKKIYIFISDL